MFVVLSATAIPAHLRGYISRFLVQVDTNLFVGKTSRRVADLLWERIAEAACEGFATMILSVADSEQGFEIRRSGDSHRQIADFDGISLALWHGQLDSTG